MNNSKVWKVALIAAAALAFGTFVAAQESHSVESAVTLLTVENSFDRNGDLFRSAVVRQTWRADGSTAQESLVTVVKRGTTTRSTKIRDLAAGRETTSYPDLGVKMVEEIPEKLRHSNHVATSKCLETIRARGEQIGDDPYHRRMPNGNSTLEARYDPSLGCESVEYRIVDGDRVKTEKKVLSRSQGADESLFHVDPSLKAVTRIGWVEAWKKDRRRPMSTSPDFLVKLRQLDATRPLLEIDE